MAGYFKYILLTSIILVLAYSCGTGIPDSENSNNNIVIADSIKLKDGKSLFWYCFDNGVLGYSTGSLVIAKNRNGIIQKQTPLLISDGITKIQLKSFDTLNVYILYGFSIDEQIEYPKNSIIKQVNLIYGGKHSDLIVNRIEKDR